MPAVLGMGAYVIGRAVGWHPEVLGFTALAAGLLFVRGARSRDMSAARRAELASQELPEATPEVVTLVERGRKIEAIKRYREQNPGIGLKQAKDIIDGL
jgi:ribosomal protein L7/L12